MTTAPLQASVLLGDEAVALAALHAGISAAYAYPGTPSTEIFEYLHANDILSKLFETNFYSQ